ncbi:phage tail protein [Xenorhabdus stockiae]|uniref:phage tail protein n=1 Tax=Xenorhabdus stockiae TaxID=351614 RepID=UPI0040636450
MSNKYFALLTDSGANKLENAATSGNKLEITHMAVGDGHLPTPDANQSQLINEKHRAEIDRLFIDPNNPNQIIVEQIIPETEGNWWIREIGLFDEDNTLIAVGNCAALYKSQMQEQTVRMVLPIGDRNLTGWIAELISGLATRSYVRGKIRDHAESRNHPDATLKNKGFVILSSAVDSNSEAHAATSKAVKSTHELAQKAYNLADPVNAMKKWVPLTRKINHKELVNDINLNAADVDAYNKTEIDARISPIQQDVVQAMKLADNANQNATSAINNAENKVPLTRKINDKELINDIRLIAADVDAYNKIEIDALISPIQQDVVQAMKLADNANQNATSAINNAENKVPLTRKINDKELVNDIRLIAADVDAYNKTETDALIAPIQQDVVQAMKLADTANQNATSAINNAENKVPLTRKINDKELVNDIRLIAADVDAYNKTETDALIAPIQQDVVQAMKLADTANQNATSAINNAESKVPLTRKINDKELVNDIRLSAADVDAYNKAETDALIAPIQQDVMQAMKLADTANQNATSAINNAENKVPLTRKINDKELVNDIRLSAADVDAYNKAETDALIAPIQQDVMQAMRQADTAIKDAENKVPLTRKINHKELINDINLNAADVDAYNRTETDALIAPIQQDVVQAMKLADTANQNATSAIRDAESKVPLTRRINGKELVNDVKLIASDVNAYDKEETDQLIDGVKELANAANNNADSKVPVFRTINNKALLTDIMLNASDVDTYAKGEIDQQINTVRKLANDANNNVNGKVPLTRTVNNKALLTDITLTALDVGTYNKNEIDSRLDKVTKNANGRLAKDENGADIPDKNAFVKNIGLGDLIGSKIESQLIGQDATIINLGKITQISGVAIASTPIKQENTSIVGGVTYYTNYYKIRLPVSLPNGIISCHASIACNNFDSQGPSHLADVRTQRSNSDGVGLSQDTLTISVTTPELGWTPEFYYEVTGY